MAFVSKKSTVVFINAEVTEGTAVDPSASSDAVGILADGFSMDGEKELVERNILRSAIGKAIPITGIKSATASIGVEVAANETEGAAPEFDLLLKSLLGGKRSIADEVTSGASHTTSVINIADADIADFSRGDIVVVKAAGAYHMSPISAVDDSSVAASGSITGSVGVLEFEAVEGGAAGNSIEVVLVGGETAEAETIAVVGSVITIGIESGVSIASDIADLIEGDVDASALVSVVVTEGAMEADSVTLSGGESANITLLVPMASAPADAVKIAPATVYYGANSGHSNLTVTAWMESAIKIQASGCKVASMSLDNFATGQLPSFNFSLNGMNYVESVASSSVVAAFDSATPPLVLSACVYMDGAAITVQDVGLSVDNTLGRITSTCEANGVKGQLVGERAISGSFTAYMSTTDVSIYSKFNANTEFSLFLRAQNPSGVSGETQNHIGIYLPKCIIVGQPKADSDGVMTIQVSFQAGFDDNNEDIFMAFV